MVKRFISILLFCAILTQTFLISVPTVSASDAHAVEYAGGEGTAGNPYLIATAGHLQRLSAEVNSGRMSERTVHFLQTADIDLRGVNFTPIGTALHRFSGVYDGGGHTIINLNLPHDSRQSQGLFGWIRGNAPDGHEAGVRNLNLLNSTVRGFLTVGLLAGTVESAFIENCAVSGNVYAYTHNAGGIIGNGWNARLSNLIFKGKVTAAQNVGGIIGIAGPRTYITDCGVVDSVISAVELAEDIEDPIFTMHDGSNAGGIVGPFGSGDIIRCYVERSVINAVHHAHGLIGLIHQPEGPVNIRECFVSADIFVSEGEAASFISFGYTHHGIDYENQPTPSDVPVKDCYGIGVIETNGHTNHVFIANNYFDVESCYVSAVYINHSESGTGAFIGMNNNIEGTVNCYFDASKTDLTDEAATGLDASQMRSTHSFTGFNFDNIWAINPSINNGMPYLRNNPPGRQFPEIEVNVPDYVPEEPSDRMRGSFAISVPEKTGVTTVPVRGLSEPGANITVYCNFVEVGRTQANHVGRWVMTFELPGNHSYEAFWIYAKKEAGANTEYSFGRELIYDANFPVIKSIEVIAPGPETKKLYFEPLNPSFRKVFYVYTEGFDQFTFIAKFTENSRPVENVFAEIRDREGNIHRLPAVYDSRQGGYVASGMFTTFTAPSGCRFVFEDTGNPTISYELISEEIWLTEDVSAYLQENKELEDFLIKTYEENGITIQKHEHEKGYTILYREDLELIKAVSLGTPSVSELVESGYVLLPDTSGREMYWKQNGNSIFYTDFYTGEAFEIRYNDVFFHRRRTAEERLYLEIEQSLKNIMYEIAEYAMSYDPDSVLSDFISRQWFSGKELYSNISISAANAMGSATVSMSSGFGFGVHIVNPVNPLTVPLPPIVPPIVPPIPIPIPQVIDRDNDEEPQSDDFEFDPIDDPSGYIYEAVHENRIEGATATVFYRDGDRAVQWDAEEYEQINPQITDIEGRYAWDVPMGYWKVVVEKNGYENVESEWLRVPPPRTEVNLGLVSLAAPEVSAVFAYGDEIIIQFSRFMKISALTDAQIKIEQGGESVAVTITPAPSSDPELSNEARVKPPAGTEFAGSVKVEISGAEGYNNRIITPYSAEHDVQLRPVSIIVDDFNVAYGETAEVRVTVLPKEAGAGKTIYARSTSSQLLSVTEKAVVQDDGTAVFEVTGVLPGTARLTFTLDGSPLSTAKMVNQEIWLNPFADINERDWFYDNVMYVYKHNLMTGTGTNPMTFSPDMTFTCGMAVTVLYRMAGSPDTGSESGGKWYADAVNWAAANGLTDGIGEGSIFDPQSPVTRQDFVVMLSRYLDLMELALPEIREYPGFNDEADAADYAKGAIEQLFKASVINGKGAGIFDPKGNATRAEIAAMFQRFLEAAMK